MKIDATTFAKLPDHLKALFTKAPNPGSDEVLAGFPVTGPSTVSVRDPNGSMGYHGGASGLPGVLSGHNDTGSAARFFYCAKASKHDRNAGLDNAPKKTAGVGDEHPSGSFNERLGKTPTAPRANHHPTVKPTDLMAYLCRLVTPPGGTVLDPFMGSGSTGKAALREGFKFIGCELDAAYHNIAEGRLLAESEASLKAAA